MSAVPGNVFCGACEQYLTQKQFESHMCIGAPTVAPQSVLSEAARLVDGDRQTAYGHPRDNHRCTAELWNAYIKRRYHVIVQLDAYDVCMLNILQKMSRLAHTRQRDGLVDIAGFARNAEMVDE